MQDSSQIEARCWPFSAAHLDLQPAAGSVAGPHVKPEGQVGKPHGGDVELHAPRAGAGALAGIPGGLPTRVVRANRIRRADSG